jgi:outer membrane protein insertion porin family/translocation and assembly module TamA
MIPRGRRGGWALLLAVLLAVTARTSRAQELTCGPGDVEVMKLTFDGNRAFASSVLQDGIVTAPSSWWQRTVRFPAFVGTRRCFESDTLAHDRLRLIIWYRNHGYASVTVDTVVTRLSPSRLTVRFSINEGPPTIVDSLVFTGLDSLPARERESVLKALPSRKGQPFDKYANDTTRATITDRLHNGGYPDAEVLINSDTRLAARRASVEFAVSTGTRMHLGAIVLNVAPRPGAEREVRDRTIRKIAALNAGDLYSQQELERAKRTLYQTQAFSRVGVTPDSTRAKGDTTVPVTLQLTEGYMHAAHAGVGYGTLDCFRTTGDYTAYALDGTATRLDLNARVSKIGVGQPLSGLGALCPIAQSDLYSKDLNYFSGVTLSRPAIFRGIVPSYSVYSERRSEFDAYLRTTPVGGNVTLARPLGLVSEAFSYSVEYGRTEAQPALLCAVFNACEATDQASVQRLQRLAVASFSIERNGSDNPVEPTRGTVLRFEFRTAGAYTGSDPSLHFNKVLVDGSAYLPAGRSVVLAARLRFGAVLGSSFGFDNSATFIPQQERLFAGGQTTVRGYQQNELGPAVYIPAAYDTLHADGSPFPHGVALKAGDTAYFSSSSAAGGLRTVPTGGNALAVAMVEARIRSPFLPKILEWAIFLDGGAVWNIGKEGESIGLNSLRWTPGFGARIHTGFGALRLDLAYNPYQQPAGAAYFDAPVASGGALYCVSPKNALQVTPVLANGIPTGAVTQAAGVCPGSFRPPLQSAWYKRFAFVLTLGEAF